jgi:GTPase SAR1 family protein
LNYWYNLFVDNIGKNVILGVIGNKSDLISKQEVQDKEGIAFAEKHNALFAQISVKENKVGIDAFMDNLIREYLSSKVEKDFEILENREKGIVLSKELGKNYGENNGGCCGGKAKARKKKYDDIIKNKKGSIHSIFLGENNVGKTSLIKRIKGEKFDKNEQHTSFLNEEETNYTNSTMQINLKIYDASNDEKDQNIEKMKQCQIFFLVYDLSKNETLKKVGDLIKEIKNLKEGENNKKDFILVIVGNKKDLVEKNNNKKYEEEGKALSNKNNSIFFSVSALNNDEIQNIIAMAVESYINLP